MNADSDPSQAVVTVRLADGDFDRARIALWQRLQQEDPSLPSLPAAAAGVLELAGDGLRVRCVGAAAQKCLALEVHHPATGDLWECGFADTGAQGCVGFRRLVHGSCPLAQAAWDTTVTAFGGAQEYRARHVPSFLAMTGAYLAETGLTLVQDREALERLAGDLAYWKSLALAQARMLRTLGRQAPPREASGPLEDAAAKPAAPVEPVRVWELAALDEWAALNSHRIIVLPRAVAAAKRSMYARPALVFECLEVLAHTYRLVKLGELERDRLLQDLRPLAVDIGGSIEPARAGQAGDEYFVRWNGRRRFLDQHLSKGGSRDSRFSMRIYFTWDEDLQKVLVGWLPSHLSNSLD
jgi:hypothetical protein